MVEIAGFGPPPKPDGERLRRNASTFSWVDLPAGGRKGKPPKLPEWRVWHPRTETWWAELWRTPQAVMWDQTGRSLHVMAAMMDDLISGRAEAAKVSSEMRQHEDRHGLNARSLMSLRWRIVDEAKATPAPAPAKKAAKRKGAATVTPLADRRARVTEQLGGKT